MNFRFDIIQEYLPFFLQGMGLTILMSVIGVLMGCILGFFIALGKMSPILIVRLPFIWYINFLRGTPLLVQLFLFHFAVLPSLLGETTPVLSVIVTLSLNSSAYVAEIFRAGLQSIDKGQAEAAHSLGMNKVQVMWHVLLPQAFKRSIPPLGNEFIVLLKDSSLGAMIAAQDVLYWGRAASNEYLKVWEPYLMVALIYLVLTLSLTYLLNYIEKRLDVK
ncbi:amino acid ABC transporter permease [Gracilibacillus alcaliphilus]|uniref:amino acid ABC transporter permease n=1 Tax=Gracilibacillus alcaliphilus TaxID=1401441 RepID=UPI00195AE3E0|nr:amino acid ABC transporter permease [Gracilibacillus alcaliphilus]MBM7677088.1 polar amino acid transport system permease protein [Gracilibacillus alcaliphilus]